MFQITTESFIVPFFLPLVLHLPIPPFTPPLLPCFPHFSDNIASKGVEQRQQEEEGCWGFYSPSGRDVCVCICGTFHLVAVCVFISLQCICTVIILPMSGYKLSQRNNSLALGCMHSMPPLLSIHLALSLRSVSLLFISLGQSLEALVREDRSTLLQVWGSVQPSFLLQTWDVL